MRVVKSGHHEVPGQVDHLRLWTLESLDVGILAHGQNAVAANRNRLFPINRTELRVRRNARVDIGMDIDGICLGPGSSSRLTTRQILRLQEQRRETSAGQNESGNENPVPRLSLLLRNVEFQYRLQLLGGAALQRCEKEALCQRGFSPQGREFSHYSPAPASASMVNRIRFNANSRPLLSNHSCNVCAPPPEPPPPMAMASSPIDSGIFASVDARCTCAALFSCVSTARITCKIRDPTASSPAGRLPIATTSQLTPEGRFCTGDRISADIVSSSTARFSASRSVCCSGSVSLIVVERISTFILADSGIELTDVPPRITPMLNVVFGVTGTCVDVNVSMARARITIGFGAPKSLHECPHGPRTLTSKRRPPGASATIVSEPAPSSTTL